jgi:hypothetical protein
VTFDYSDDAVYAIMVFDNIKFRARFKTLTPKNVKGWMKKVFVNILN